MSTKPSPPTHQTASDPLLPRSVRRWLFGLMGILTAGAIYLAAVRQDALMQSLSAIAAYCF